MFCWCYIVVFLGLCLLNACIWFLRLVCLIFVAVLCNLLLTCCLGGICCLPLVVCLLVLLDFEFYVCLFIVVCFASGFLCDLFVFVCLRLHLGVGCSLLCFGFGLFLIAVFWIVCRFCVACVSFCFG